MNLKQMKYDLMNTRNQQRRKSRICRKERRR